MFIIIVFWLVVIGVGTYFSPARFASFHTNNSLLTIFSVSYFILAVPKRGCLGKHSCMSSPFPIAVLNGTLIFCQTTWSKESKSHRSRTNYNNKNLYCQIYCNCLSKPYVAGDEHAAPDAQHGQPDAGGCEDLSPEGLARAARTWHAHQICAAWTHRF